MKPAPEYDERGYIYRGRVVARRPAQDPDTVWSCPTCAALVIDNDRRAHESWHEGHARAHGVAEARAAWRGRDERRAADELTSLTEDMGLYEKD